MGAVQYAALMVLAAMLLLVPSPHGWTRPRPSPPSRWSIRWWWWSIPRLSLSRLRSLSSNPVTADWPEGVARHVLDRVDSTNSHAMRLAPSLTGPAWIMARRQEAGRGRRGRAWADPPGNFAASLVMRPSGNPAEAARFSFVAALAVHDALRTLCGPSLNLALKWPNDVLLGRAGGYPAEHRRRRAGDAGVGIGVNLVSAPDDVEAGAPPGLLWERDWPQIAPEDLLDAIAAAFDVWQRQMEAFGFGPIRNAWRPALRPARGITARTGVRDAGAVRRHR